MKTTLLRLLPIRWVQAFQTFKLLWAGDYLRLRRRQTEQEMGASALATLTLRQRYSGLQASPATLPDLGQYEARVYSQNGEDGILLYLLSQVGAIGHTFIEFGMGDGRTCNTANLSLNFGWSGLLMDGNPAHVAGAQAYYRQRLGEAAGRVQIAHCLVTAENIDDALRSHGMAGPVDLLSIDIDGNDFWVWKAISAVQPRLVVVEYNASLGPTASLTIPYDPAFAARRRHPSGLYHGASLAALTKLGEDKGYRLAGCDSNGINAFFVHSDLFPADWQLVTPAQAFRPHRFRSERLSPQAQWDMISRLPFERI